MNFPCEPLHPQEAWSQMGAKHGKKTSPLHLTLILDEGLKITRHMNLTSDPSLKPSGWHGWKFISILQHSSVAASVPGVLPIPFPHPCGGPFDGRHQARDDRAGPQDSQAPWSINKHHPWSEIHGALAGRPEGLRTLSRQQGRNVRIPWFLLEPILQSSWSPKKTARHETRSGATHLKPAKLEASEQTGHGGWGWMSWINGASCLSELSESFRHRRDSSFIWNIEKGYEVGGRRIQHVSKCRKWTSIQNQVHQLLNGSEMFRVSSCQNRS